MKILIVDDQTINRRLLRATLEAEGMEVVEARDGMEALEFLSDQMVDAVISDILMPNMDGYRFCNELRRDERLKRLPLIFYTSTYTSPGDQQLAMDVGADCYLTKPVSAERILEALRDVTSGDRSSGRADSPAPNPQFIMKQYSDALVRKLEEKNEALERTIASLRAANDRIAELNGRLEERVEERTAQLKAANEKLVQQNEEIQGFYHTLSHELKTPLTSTGEFISIIGDGLAGPVNDTQIEYLGLARESCDQMRICLNDLLDSTRLETGKFALELKTCAMTELIQRAVAALVPEAENKGIHLTASVLSVLPEMRVDPHRITQILNNLVNNALKFTPSGGSICVAVGKSDSSDGMARISVADTGVGISPEHLAHVFERLYQVKDSASGSKKGLGLGLYLCRQLVELHGGRIEVESIPGEGCTFTFFVPTDLRDQVSPSEAVIPG